MRFMRVKEISEKTGIPPSTINLYVSQQKFPRFIKTSPKVKVWVEEDVEKWMEEQVENGNK